jgi:hypothetical protein
MNPEAEQGQTRWGVRMDAELQARLLEYLRGRDTPQKSTDIATASKKHVLEVEQNLDQMSEANLVQYRPIEGAATGNRNCGRLGTMLRCARFEPHADRTRTSSTCQRRSRAKTSSSAEVLLWLDAIPHFHSHPGIPLSQSAFQENRRGGVPC